MATVEDGLVWVGRTSAAPVLERAPVAVPERRRHEQAAQQLRRGLGAILLGAGLLGAVAAGGALAVTADLQVQATTARVQDLQATQRQLAVEAAQLANPDVIHQEAVDRYGMRPVAGYTPIALQPVPPAVAETPPHAAEAVLPLPPGPAPGGAADLAGRLAAWLHAVRVG